MVRTILECKDLSSLVHTDLGTWSISLPPCHWVFPTLDLLVVHLFVNINNTSHCHVFIGVVVSNSSQAFDLRFNTCRVSSSGSGLWICDSLWLPGRLHKYLVVGLREPDLLVRYHLPPNTCLFTLLKTLTTIILLPPSFTVSIRKSLFSISMIDD